MELFSKKQRKYLNRALICINHFKHDHRSFDEWRSYFYNKRNIWMEFSWDLFISNVILHDCNSSRVFYLDYQNNWTKNWFEFFALQINFAYVTITNRCFDVSKIDEYYLNFCYSLVIWFTCCEYSNFCIEIFDIIEKTLVIIHL